MISPTTTTKATVFSVLTTFSTELARVLMRRIRMPSKSGATSSSASCGMSEGGSIRRSPAYPSSHCAVGGAGHDGERAEQEREHDREADAASRGARRPRRERRDADAREQDERDDRGGIGAERRGHEPPEQRRYHEEEDETPQQAPGVPQLLADRVRSEREPHLQHERRDQRGAREPAQRFHRGLLKQSSCHGDDQKVARGAGSRARGDVG